MASCTPCLSADNDSERQTVAHSQFEKGNTGWHSIWGNGSPEMVTPSFVAQVKSVCMASPGRWSWGKNSSCSGPSLAFHSVTRLYRVRSWPGLYWSGYFSTRWSKIVFDSSSGASFNRFSISGQCFSNGLDRVRQVR
jgi:hypothetical protein